MGYLGAKIKRIREAQGISRPDLAKAVGVTTNYMGMIEGGGRLPSLPVLIDIARALGGHFELVFRMKYAKKK